MMNKTIDELEQQMATMMQGFTDFLSEHCQSMGVANAVNRLETARREVLLMQQAAEETLRKAESAKRESQAARQLVESQNLTIKVLQEKNDQLATKVAELSDKVAKAREWAAKINKKIQ